MRDTEPLVMQVQLLLERMARRGHTLALAESCTGGLLGDVVTDVAGSSRVFRLGIVAYHDDAKRDILHVPPALMERHGAVSAEVCAAMARGVRAAAGATHAVAITGIAGPTGGTPQKPVGLTFIAVESPQGLAAERFTFPGTRRENKVAACREAVRMLLAALGGP